MLFTIFMISGSNSPIIAIPQTRLNTAVNFNSNATANYTKSSKRKQRNANEGTGVISNQGHMFVGSLIIYENQKLDKAVPAPKYGSSEFYTTIYNDGNVENTIKQNQKVPDGKDKRLFYMQLGGTPSYRLVNHNIAKGKEIVIHKQVKEPDSLKVSTGLISDNNQNHEISLHSVLPSSIVTVHIDRNDLLTYPDQAASLKAGLNNFKDTSVYEDVNDYLNYGIEGVKSFVYANGDFYDPNIYEINDKREKKFIYTNNTQYLVSYSPKNFAKNIRTTSWSDQVWIKNNIKNKPYRITGATEM